MRTWGIMLIISGLLLMPIGFIFSVRYATEERESTINTDNYQDRLAEYYEKGHEYRGAYPRQSHEKTWDDEEIFISSLTFFGQWFFLAGCILYGADAIRSCLEHNAMKIGERLTFIAKQMEYNAMKIGERLAFIAKQTPRKSEETQRKEAAEAAEEAAAVAKKAAEEEAKKAEEEAKKAVEAAAAKPVQSPPKGQEQAMSDKDVMSTAKLIFLILTYPIWGPVICVLGFLAQCLNVIVSIVRGIYGLITGKPQEGLFDLGVSDEDIDRLGRGGPGP